MFTDHRGGKRPLLRCTIVTFSVETVESMSGMSGDPASEPSGEPEDAATYRRLCWRSRRGMLELDLALMPFVERTLPSLPAAGLARFGRLLEHDDWDIYDWIQGRSEPPDADLAGIVAEVRAANAP
jgi:antitoxin CptB